MKSIRESILKYSKYIFLTVIIALIGASLKFVIPIIAKILLGSVEIKNFSETSNYLLYFFLALIGGYLCSICYQIFLLKFSLIFNCIESKELFKKLFYVKLPFIRKYGPTYFTNRILPGLNDFFGLIGTSFANAFVAVITIIIACVLILLLNKVLFFIFVILFPLNFFSYRKLNRKLQEKSVKLQEVSAINIKNIINLTQNIEEIKQISNHDAFSKIVEKYMYNLQKKHNEVNRYAKIMSSTIQFFVDILKNGVLFLTIYYFLQGQMVFANLVFINLIFSIYFNALTNLNSINISMRDVKAFLGFINQDILGQVEQDSGKEILTDIDKITLDIKNFSYQPGERILKNLKLEIKNGQKVSIVGKAGCGKTTLGRLLVRYYKAKRILINDRDISDYTLTSLRRKIYIVSQNPYVFPGNVKENIVMGSNNFDQEKFRELIRMPFLSNLIEELPNGLMTDIGEGGANLSGGQKQKITIARMLIHNPDLIIFDESTSSMDSHSEEMVYKNIDYLLEDKTVIKISHRLSTVKNADIILLLKNGEIVDVGSHNDLLKNSKEYREMFASQLT